jgi:hypothetical protein
VGLFAVSPGQIPDLRPIEHAPGRGTTGAGGAMLRRGDLNSVRALDNTRRQSSGRIDARLSHARCGGARFRARRAVVGPRRPPGTYYMLRFGPGLDEAAGSAVGGPPVRPHAMEAHRRGRGLGLIRKAGRRPRHQPHCSE